MLQIDDSYFKDFGYQNRYHIESLEQINSESGRYYQVPNGKKYPSVSTVLSATSDKTALDEWRKRVGDKEADRISRHARIRGTSVHAMCENYLLGNKQKFIKAQKEAMQDVLQNWASIKYILDSSVDEVYASEIQMYSDRYRIAGTADMVARWNGKRVIIDFKTSRKPKKLEWIPHYFTQCEAYACMWEERFEESIEGLVVLMSVDHQREPSIFIEPREKYHSSLIEHRTKFYKMFGV